MTQWHKAGEPIPEQPVGNESFVIGEHGVGVGRLDGNTLHLRPEPPESFLRGYLTCAFWSSTDDAGEPLDRQYDTLNLAHSALEEAKRVCADFQANNAALLAQYPLGEEHAGHDFWLTRNRHGAGFWDRGLGHLGDELTKQAHAYGECSLYVGDDGKLYFQ